MAKIYVGNLPFSTTEAELRQLFEPHGAVMSSSIVMDRDTGRPRGFGFVEMSDDAQAKVAIEKLNGYPVGGRALVVNEARPREPKPFGGGGGGGGRGGWSSGGGGGGRSGSGGGGGGGRGGRAGDRESDRDSRWQ